MSTIWVAIALIVIARWFFQSPLAEATAESIRRSHGKPDPRVPEALDRVTGELAQLREQFNELAERVDFTERALADVRRRGALNA